jgi:hypothetical protein
MEGPKHWQLPVLVIVVVAVVAIEFIGREYYF